MLLTRLLIFPLALLAKDVLAAESGSRINAILSEHGLRCHGAKVQDGNLRIDQLDRTLVQGPDADRWHEVHNRLNTGEMPPEDEPQLKDDELNTAAGGCVPAVRTSRMRHVVKVTALEREIGIFMSAFEILSSENDDVSLSSQCLPNSTH